MNRVLKCIPLCLWILFVNGSCKGQVVLSGPAIDMSRENSENQYLDTIGFKFNISYPDTIHFVYIFFAELESCYSNNIIADVNYDPEKLDVEGSQVTAWFDLSEHRISTIDYMRLHISDYEGVYTQPITIGDQNKFYNSCK